MTTRLVAALVTLLVGVIPLTLVPNATGVAAQTNDPAQLPQPRIGLGMAAVNGKLYAIGGLTGNNQITDLVEEYDPSTNVWVQKARMPTPRGMLGVAAAGTKIYAVGGQAGSGWSAALEEYDVASNTWTRRASMSEPRGWLGAAVLDGKLYAVGGLAIDTCCLRATVEEYDPTSDTWRLRASLPIEREWPVVVASHGKLYAIGGNIWTSAPGPGNTVDTVDEYDPLTNAWQPRANMPTPRHYLAGVAASNGKVYVLGGRYWGNAGSPALSAVEEYDPLTNTWRTRADMPTPLLLFGAAEASDGRIYAVGGSSGSGIVDVVEAYDPATNAWRPDHYAPTIQVLSVNHGAAFTNDIIVTLSIQASDVGVGVSHMRFSNDGTVWSAWEPYAPSKDWMLSTGGDGTRTVQAQVRDGLGNESPVLTDTIVMETVAPTVSAVSINAGALASTSTVVSLGLQASDSAGGSGVSEMSFSNDGGASWSAWEPYASPKGWSLSPGDGPKTAQVRVRDLAGNVSASASDTITLDTTVSTSYGITVNNAAVWTNTTAVTLSIPAAAGTAKMMLSNDGSFPGAQWEPYDTHKPWVLDRFEGSPVTMIVYVRFGDANNAELPNSRSFDNIILDIDPPTGSVAVAGGSSPTSSRDGAASPVPNSLVRTVQLSATDTQSGSAMTMRLSNRADFAGAIWKPFASSVTWDFNGGNTVYAQFKDGAGNVSQTYSQTIAGGGGPGPSPTPSCAPRPRIVVSVQKSGGQLLVTLGTTGANNGLRAVRFDSFRTAVVDVGDQMNQFAPFAVSIPAGQEPTALQFTVRRLPGAQSATVRLVVIDGCGEWSTFVGSGPGAF